MHVSLSPMFGEVKNNPTTLHPHPITRGRHWRRPRATVHARLHARAVCSARRASADVAWRFWCVVKFWIWANKWVSCENPVFGHSAHPPSATAAAAASAANSKGTDTQRLGRTAAAPEGWHVRSSSTCELVALVAPLVRRSSECGIICMLCHTV